MKPVYFISALIVLSVAALFVFYVFAPQANGADGGERPGGERPGGKETMGENNPAPGDEGDADKDDGAAPGSPVEDVADAEPLAGVTVVFSGLSGKAGQIPPPTELSQALEAANDQLNKAIARRIKIYDEYNAAKKELESATDVKRSAELLETIARLDAEKSAAGGKVRELRTRSDSIKSELAEFAKHVTYKVYASGNKIRMEYGRERVIIVDLDTGMRHILAPDKRKAFSCTCDYWAEHSRISDIALETSNRAFIEQRKTEIDELEGGAREFAERQIAEMEEQLKNLKYARAAVLKPDGETKTIGDIETDAYTARVRGLFFSTTWISHSEEHVEAVAPIKAFVETCIGKYGYIFFYEENADATAFLEGLPVAAEYKALDENHFNTRTFVSVSSDPLDPGLFEIPADYEKDEWKSKLVPEPEKEDVETAPEEE